MARVLIIDDDEVARLQLGSLLEADGHEVQFAPNGDVALKLYKRGPYNVCLVDLVMPVKNGLQTIRELKAMDSNVRIIAVTGISPENLDMAKEFGATQTLTKPIDPQKLTLAVRQALGRSRWFKRPDLEDEK